MNFTQLEYFLAVAGSGKFGTAAEHAYVSQSCLSKQIKSLEEELGVKLFIRGHEGAHLTPAGEMFMDFAGRAYRDYESILLNLERYNSTSQYHVRVGALPLVGVYGLHTELSNFQVENMTTQIDLYERNQDEILKRMEMNRLDVAILRTELLSAEKYDWVPLIVDEVIIVCPTGHPLSRTVHLSIEELRDERFVMLEPQSAIHTIFVERCRAAGFSPNIIFTHSRHQPLLSAVNRGIGITALPRVLACDGGEMAVSFVELDDPIYTQIGLVFPKGRDLTPWAEKLVEYFRKAFPEPRAANDHECDGSMR